MVENKRAAEISRLNEQQVAFRCGVSMPSFHEKPVVDERIDKVKQSIKANRIE